MKYWFTSDTHFGHENIIKYCNRPFSSIQEMNRKLILNWNKVVESNDVVVHIGDFCFGDPLEYLKQLNGHIVFIKGNHDNKKSLNARILNLDMMINSIHIYCTHLPENYSRKYKLNLVGHVHEKWKVKKTKYSTLVNIGVDVWDYMPVSFDEIIKGGII